jgi:hypothetical protein
MRRKENGDAMSSPQFQKHLPQFAPGNGVEAGARFVEDQESGLVQQSFGDLDAPALAAGQFSNEIIFPAGETQPPEESNDPIL